MPPDSASPTTSAPSSAVSGSIVERLNDYELTLIVATLGMFTGLFVWALLKVAASPPPVALVLALSMLTLAAVAGGIITNNGDYITLAATGIGALAGAVSSTWMRGPVEEPPTTPASTEPPDTEVSQ